MTSMVDTNLFYKKNEHPIHGTWLSVDVVAFTEDEPEAKVVLITRQGTPHRGKPTLPGGLLAAWDGETVEQAARRIVAEKVGVPLAGDPVVVDVVSDPQRDERGHTVSIVVAVRVPADTTGAVSVKDVPDNMPFGHTNMVRDTVTALRERLFVDTKTTRAMLGDITTVPYTHAMMSALETVGDATVRSRLERSGMYVKSNNLASKGTGRPATVWTFRN